VKRTPTDSLVPAHLRDEPFIEDMLKQAKAKSLKEVRIHLKANGKIR
jgi:hypothetical protein